VRSMFAFRVESTSGKGTTLSSSPVINSVKCLCSD
jgi:hypothetical protein